MPKVSVYFPDDLYVAARSYGLPISTLAQRAVEQALRAAQTDEWVRQVRARTPRVAARLDVREALDAARDEFGA